ncbi:MAG: hypothetical protein JXB29_12645 [Sedimentisphaerales bacterium]|nr:hypothetical protein [Sedimentisphaerales bacterium]
MTDGQGTGGLSGTNYSGTISECYAMGDVSGWNNVGGLTGWTAMSPDFLDSYATGDVSGNEGVGGLVGLLQGSIVDCFTAGRVTGVSDVGGLVGDMWYGAYTACFWDSDINPDVNGIGNATDPNVIGKSTAEMQKESTFTDWDFIEIWNIGENQTYPYLRVYPAGDLNYDGVVNLPDFAIFAEHWLAGVE